MIDWNCHFCFVFYLTKVQFVSHFAIPLNRFGRSNYLKEIFLRHENFSLFSKHFICQTCNQKILLLFPFQSEIKSWTLTKIIQNATVYKYNESNWDGLVLNGISFAIVEVLLSKSLFKKCNIKSLMSFQLFLLDIAWIIFTFTNNTFTCYTYQCFKSEMKERGNVFFKCATWCC